MTDPSEFGPHGKPWSKTGPGGPFDVVVIGSGMGGQAAAALLAKVGRRVLLLEQHYEPGGFTHTFRRGPWRWDVGVHAVGEVTPRSLPGRILRWLSDGQLEWASLGSTYDRFLFPGDFRIDFPDSPEQFKENLLAAAPQERAGIDEYFRAVREVAGSMRLYYLARLAPPSWGHFADLTLARRAQAFLEERTSARIGRLTQNPRLAALLTAQWGYYGSPPSRSSFAMQALVAKHFLWGGYYPVGGSQQIARSLLSSVATQGGWTRVATPVRQIKIEGGRAVGVELEDGEVIRAPRVISAVGVAATCARMLPPELNNTPWARGVAKLTPAPAHVCLYLGLNGDPRPAGASAANQWLYETWSMEASAWQIDQAPLPDAPVLYVSFPSLKDPRHQGEYHTAEVVTFVPYGAFQRWQGTRWMKRGEDYEAFKAQLTERLLAQLHRHLPGLRPLIAHAELSTPLSTEKFVRPMAGSIYGLEPTPERFANPYLRPRSPIPGLYFAGSEVATVGVIGALMGGVLAAAAADPVSVLSALRRL
jgi:all-trans-retinol 13,14-reductase